MLKRTMTAVSVVLILATLSSSSFAFGWREKKGFDSGKMIERFSKDLDLTQNQKDEFASNSEEIEKASKDIHDKNRQLMEKVRAEIAKDNPDEKFIGEAVQTINQNNAQLQMKRLQNIIQFRKSLTPEQKKKFEDAMKKRKSRDLDSDKK